MGRGVHADLAAQPLHGTGLHLRTNGARPISVEALDEGLLEIALAREELRGGYVLTRIQGKGGRSRWLLDDQYADVRRASLNSEPASVVAERTLAQIRREEGT